MFSRQLLGKVREFPRGETDKGSSGQAQHPNKKREQPKTEVRKKQGAQGSHLQRRYHISNLRHPVNTELPEAAAAPAPPGRPGTSGGASWVLGAGTATNRGALSRAAGATGRPKRRRRRLEHFGSTLPRPRPSTHPRQGMQRWVQNNSDEERERRDGNVKRTARCQSKAGGKCDRREKGSNKTLHVVSLAQLQIHQPPPPPIETNHRFTCCHMRRDRTQSGPSSVIATGTVPRRISRPADVEYIATENHNRRSNDVACLPRCTAFEKALESKKYP